MPREVYELVKRAGVKVYFADRRTTKWWNGSKDDDDLTLYGGWYWYREHKGTVLETDQDGPYRSESAAYRDAFQKLQLRRNKGRPTTPTTRAFW